MRASLSVAIQRRILVHPVTDLASTTGATFYIQNTFQPIRATALRFRP